jgi:MFS family permease
MHQIGIKRTMLIGLTLMTLSSALSFWMTAYWQFQLTWGLISGVGSGAVASVLGAAVVNRWFKERKGLAMGLLGASTATGSLIIIPVLAWLSSGVFWRPVILFVTCTTAILIPLVLWLVSERPEDKGVLRFGESQRAEMANSGPSERWMALSVLKRAIAKPVFWLLSGSFFVCGLTTNGLIGNAEGPIVYGWVQVAHQIGAATAAFGAGYAREWTGTYDPAFVITGILALVTTVAMLAPHKAKGHLAANA